MEQGFVFVPLQDVLRQNLGRAVKDRDESPVGEPLEVAAMQETLGNSLRALGEASLAAEVLEKALATREARHAPNDPNTLATMNNLAAAYRSAGLPGRRWPGRPPGG